MRVIAGEAKGVRLAPVPAGTRPVSDRAREGLFSSLGVLVEGARCLDLFAGSGAVGIEALSRGATACTFVERSRQAAAVIRENLARTKLSDRADVRVADVRSYLRARSRVVVPADLVFVDPPYETAAGSLGEVVEALDGGWLAADEWVVVVTRGQKGSLPAVPVHWAPWRQLRYGDSLLTLYREVGWA
jgi:16S rRNA (guanine966-N2)-methyltransferase